MAPNASGPLIEALAALDGALVALELDYALIGGLAVIVHGVPRATVDVDVTLDGSRADPRRLGEALSTHGIEGRIDDAIGFAERNSVLLLRHVPTGTPIDVSFGFLPFELEAIANARVEEVGPVRARVARVEDLIVQKAVAWRERDRTDIERLVALHDDAIDWKRVDATVMDFFELLEAPERRAEFDLIVARGRGRGGARG